MFSRKRTSNEWIEDSHFGQGDIQGPAHVTPCDIGALFRTLQQDPSRRVHLGKASVGFYETYCDALGRKGFFFNVVGFLESFLNLPEDKVRRIGNVALLNSFTRGASGLSASAAVRTTGNSS